MQSACHTHFNHHNHTYYNKCLTVLRVNCTGSNAHVCTSRSAPLEKTHGYTIDTYAYRVPHDRTRETRTYTHKHQTVKWYIDNQQWVGTRIVSVNRTFRVCIESTRGFPVTLKMNRMKLPVTRKVQFTMCTVFSRINSFFECQSVCKIWQIDFVSHTKTTRITWMKNVGSTDEATQAK